MLITCPYCWEAFTIFVEPEYDKGETYIEDCYVCCRPVELVIMEKHEDGVEMRANRLEGNEF